MLLKSLTIQNFKGIRDPQRIELKPITLLFGPNSAGKSTVLQALAYLHEILGRNNLDADLTLMGGAAMDLGGYRNLLHSNDSMEPMRFVAVLDLSERELPNFLLGDEWLTLESVNAALYQPDKVLKGVNDVTVALSIHWSEIRQTPYASTLRIDINDKPLAIIEQQADAKDVRLKFLDIYHPLFGGEGWPEDLDSEGSADINLEDLESAFAQVDAEADADSETFGDYLDECISETFKKWGNFRGKLRVFVGDIALPTCPDGIPPRGQRLTFPAGTWQTDERASVFQTDMVISAVLSALIVGPLDLLRDLLDDIVYLGPYRNIPDRTSTAQRSPMIGRWADGSRAWDILNTETQTFLDRVNDWIARDDRFETGYRLIRRNYKELDEWQYLVGLLGGADAEENLDEVKRLLERAPTVTSLGIVDERTRTTVHARDIGVGISQLLPVVVAALETRRGIVAVEQPELHLHPKTQMGFGDLFASRIREADVIFLIETHSEHLMLRVLRRIRETTDGELPPNTFALTPDDISVYFIHIPNDQTVFKRLRIRADGEFIDKWPAGFFGERAGELF
ncbi:MAG: DUF3696 domain-containing protein [Gammaproteobacteria bacterium]|nr:DUF3696 domain-containing protein [Gammaproteobacteria bacterium]